MKTFLMKTMAALKQKQTDKTVVETSKTLKHLESELRKNIWLKNTAFPGIQCQHG